MIRLLHALQKIPALKERGLEVTAYDFTAAVIHHEGHARAAWRKAGGVYEFVPANALFPAYIACSLEELVSATEFFFENKPADGDEDAVEDCIDWMRARSASDDPQAAAKSRKTRKKPLSSVAEALRARKATERAKAKIRAKAKAKAGAKATMKAKAKPTAKASQAAPLGSLLGQYLDGLRRRVVEAPSATPCFRSANCDWATPACYPGDACRDPGVASPQNRMRD
jgi:hypothetical protein